MAKDRRRLEHKLTKLATEESTVSDGWRRIGAPAKDLLSAVATEVDETFYPVIISLRNASGEVIDFAVGHRRLRCVLGQLPEDLGQFSSVCDVELSEASLSVLDQVSELLRSHASDEEQLWVRATKAPDADTLPAGGVPADCLAQVWRTKAPDKAVAFEEFARGLTANSADWVRMTGRQVTEQSGSVKTRFGDLEDFLDLAADLSNPIFNHDQIGATLVIRGAEGAWYHAIARSKDLSLVAEVSAVVAAELPALWRAAEL